MGQAKSALRKADGYAVVPAEEPSQPSLTTLDACALHEADGCAEVTTRDASPTVPESSMNMALYCDKISAIPMRQWTRKFFHCSRPFATTCPDAPSGISTPCLCYEFYHRCIVRFGWKSIEIEKVAPTEISLHVVGFGETLRLEMRAADGRECCIICEPRSSKVVVVTWAGATFCLAGFSRPHTLTHYDNVVYSIIITDKATPN